MNVWLRNANESLRCIHLHIIVPFASLQFAEQLADVRSFSRRAVSSLDYSDGECVGVLHEIANQIGEVCAIALRNVSVVDRLLDHFECLLFLGRSWMRNDAHEIAVGLLFLGVFKVHGTSEHRVLDERIHWHIRTSQIGWDLECFVVDEIALRLR